MALARTRCPTAARRRTANRPLWVAACHHQVCEGGVTEYPLPQMLHAPFLDMMVQNAFLDMMVQNAFQVVQNAFQVVQNAFQVSTLRPVSCPLFLPCGTKRLFFVLDGCC